MNIVPSHLTPFDDRPFFDKALNYSLKNEIISPERLKVIEADFSKGIIQVARYFGTAHLRLELELALQRMVNLISLYLEDMSGGDLETAAMALRDKSFLSLSKSGSEMLKRLHALPENTLLSTRPFSDDDQRAFVEGKTSVAPMTLEEYHTELALRQQYQNMIHFAFWLAENMGIGRNEINEYDDVDFLIRTAMLVLFVEKSELRLPTRLQFARLIKAAKEPQATLNENRFNAFIKEAPSEYQNLARQSMENFIEKALPQIRHSKMTADRLLYGDSVLHYFVRESLDEASREYEREVAKEWDRITKGQGTDPTVVATVLLLLATGLPPKHKMLKSDGQKIIRVFRKSGFNSQAIADFLKAHAPEILREDLLYEWEQSYKPEAEERLADNDPEWPDKHMERGLAYLKETCQVSWKYRDR
jgi:hypothetical protein